MAEEQFTSRRARREAERLAAEQAFEAREVPEQPTEAPNSRAGLLSPLPPKKPDSKPAAAVEPPAAPAAEDTSSRIDPTPAPRTNHERGALASDHPQESRPPVNAEDRLDPTRTPLPHFQSRAEKKRYLREHGLSLRGDLSTGAMPVVADEQELAERQAAAEGRLTGPIPEVPEAATTDSKPAADADAASEAPVLGKTTAAAAEHESYDTAGFGGDSDEVAARDFEAPVTDSSAPRPTAVDGDPYDALSMPYSALDAEAPESDTAAANDASAKSDDAAESADSAEKTDPADSTDSAPTAPSETEPESVSEPEPAARSRRMPIVAPPSTSGVRVVTAASAQIPEVEQPGTNDAEASQAQSGAPAQDAQSGRTAGAADGSASGAESDDAARALAANPETRPMDAVPEAWALPNADYEDEETANPPGARIRASSVTGQDGQILMGEEPSKMPYIVLGVAAFFALALIVIALVMFL